MTEFRKLTEGEIGALAARGCRAEDWSKIQISRDLDIRGIHFCSFSGDVRIGDPQLDDRGNLPGVEINNCRIHNSTLGSGIRLINIAWLADYDIGNHVIIEAVGEISMKGESSFGNGTILDILNEGGGRELRIFDELSSQIAYLQVLYRHDQEFSAALDKLIENYCRDRRSTKGKIADYAAVRHCESIINVRVGPYARIRGAQRLQNGSLNSCREAAVEIGSGVIADDFIIQSGSTLDSAVILDKCFVGQAVRLGKQFSAENSAFFANCEGFHGEACSVFAGPYTVSHHKSSLLIAGLYSFYNAGSGTNMSNHMYKLGPVHQSILERGSKTGSFSYMLAPSRVGAFSAVIGKHYSNFDSSGFPFSYITEENQGSYLTPAMNLLTVGTRRDSEKWPKRDKRKGKTYDLINFQLFNPHIVAKMHHAHEHLMDLYQTTDKAREEIIIKGLKIRRLMLKTSAKYYELGLKIYCAQRLKELINNSVDTTDIQLLMNHHPDALQRKWVDISGLLCPGDRIDLILSAVRSAEIRNISMLHAALDNCHDTYQTEAMDYAAALICHRAEKSPDEMTAEDLVRVLDEGTKAYTKLNNLIRSDAEKEFDRSAMIGYGIDGEAHEISADFEAVRGRTDENSFIMELEEDSRAFRESMEALKKILK